MPETGASTTPDLAQATTNLENALAEFQEALKANPVPRADSPIFTALRAWRTQQARAKQMPPYVIATDAALRAIEKARPTDIASLSAVRGVGQTKAETYGQEILAVVAATA